MSSATPAAQTPPLLPSRPPSRYLWTADGWIRRVTAEPRSVTVRGWNPRAADATLPLSCGRAAPLPALPP